MIFALVGNQNCGKTTLFNALTGSNQHVGNFPGVTVDQKMGEMRDEKGCSVVDLPGIYIKGSCFSQLASLWVPPGTMRLVRWMPRVMTFAHISAKPQRIPSWLPISREP